MAGEVPDHGSRRGSDGHRAQHRRRRQPDQDTGATTPPGAAPAEVVARVGHARVPVLVLADQDHAVGAQLLRGDPGCQRLELLLGQVDVLVAGDDEHPRVGHGWAPSSWPAVLPTVGVLTGWS